MRLKVTKKESAAVARMLSGLVKRIQTISLAVEI